VLRIPRRLYEKAVERGIDLETRVVDLLLNEVELDPAEEASIRLELAERFLKESKEYLARGDAVQASEKMYKVVEECVKALAKLYRLPEQQRAVEEGGSQLLGKAARRLAKMLKEPRLEFVWAVAYDIHVRGFHEAKYGVEDVQGDMEHIEWLLHYTKKQLEERNHNGV